MQHLTRPHCKGRIINVSRTLSHTYVSADWFSLNEVQTRMSQHGGNYYDERNMPHSSCSRCTPVIARCHRSMCVSRLLNADVVIHDNSAKWRLGNIHARNFTFVFSELIKSRLHLRIMLRPWQIQSSSSCYGIWSTSMPISDVMQPS